MSKRQNPYKGFIPFQSEFDHKYACWASNHNGWARMKKFHKKLAKRRERQNLNKRLREDDL